MRGIVILSLLAVLGLGVAGLAQGEDGSADEARLMKKRVEVLELQVAYLLEREADLSRYAQTNRARGLALEKQLKRARAQGFTMAAISSTSRESLLRGLETTALAMQQGVPVLTDSQKRLLRQIDARKRAR